MTENRVPNKSENHQINPKSSQIEFHKKDKTDNMEESQIDKLKTNEKSQSKKLNFFGNKKANIKSLFEKQSVNLFHLYSSQQQKPKSIFDTNSKPLIGSQENQQSESISQNKLKVDVKIMKYQYTNDSEKIKDFPLKLFKHGNSPSKSEIYVSIEKVQNNKDILIITVRNSMTKVLLFKQVIIGKALKMENFRNRKDNLKMEYLKKKQNKKEEESSNYTQEFIKMQFMSEEECQEFSSILLNYFGA